MFSIFIEDRPPFHGKVIPGISPPLPSPFGCFLFLIVGFRRFQDPQELHLLLPHHNQPALWHYPKDHLKLFIPKWTFPFLWRPYWNYHGIWCNNNLRNPQKKVNYPTATFEPRPIQMALVWGSMPFWFPIGIKLWLERESKLEALTFSSQLFSSCVVSNPSLMQIFYNFETVKIEQFVLYSLQKTTKVNPSPSLPLLLYPSFDFYMWF